MKNNSEDLSVIKPIFYFITLYSNFCIYLFLADVVTIKGGILTDWTLKGFAVVNLMLNIYFFKSVLSYFEILNYPYLSKVIYVKELVLSPFFILFLVTLFVQWTPFVSLRPVIYIEAYILIFYFQYEFWKKMENYSESFKPDSGQNDKKS